MDHMRILRPITDIGDIDFCVHGTTLDALPSILVGVSEVNWSSLQTIFQLYT